MTMPPEGPVVQIETVEGTRPSIVLNGLFFLLALTSQDPTPVSAGGRRPRVVAVNGRGKRWTLHRCPTVEEAEHECTRIRGDLAQLGPRALLRPVESLPPS